MSREREQVYETIQKKLLDGEFHTPKEMSRLRLAATLKTTPGVVQWALARLESENVLQTKPQSGTFIREVTEAEFSRLHDLRILLEPYAAAWAAQSTTKRDLQRLERVHRDMTELVTGLENRTTSDLPEGYVDRNIRLENRFHGGIAEAAKHPEVLHLLRNLFVPLFRYADTQWSRLTFAELKASQRLTLQGHREVLDALQQKDPIKARDAMQRHLTGTFRGIEWTRGYFSNQREKT